ncbi:N-methyl-L-tryptophan oxidase [Cytobacillus kochii]|uniref:N-methyl-L-tryptophan oxidase n=1 Tax=Cytobacillus kochii TaxID=859143 RepID=UPI00259FF6E4|nr:N-methyl-L-tryptophan oxidase [Cytobacillus kochii]MDM5206041.1 N-methyl-L-tryptophan oxidase [Cytobacillus kochii]
MHYDTIIIGAGSMGMAAGYYLAKEGKKVLLIDANRPPHQKGSHHGETRIIRYAYGEGHAYVPLLLKAKQLWEEVEKESEMELFLQTGVLNIGSETSLFMKEVKTSAEKYQLPLDVYTHETVNTKWSALHLDEGMVAYHEPTSGVLKCEDCIEAYRRLSLSYGAKIVTDSVITDLSIIEGIVNIATQDGHYSGDSLIVSAGAGTNSILSYLGLQLPLNPIRKTFAWYEAQEDVYEAKQFPAFTFESPLGHYYGFPSIDGSGLKLGRHDGAVQRIESKQEVQPFNQDDEKELTTFLGRYFTEKTNVQFGKTCMYTMTPDEHFIIDQHPQYENVAIAAGFSGHGFKFSSVVGHVLSELIRGKTSPVDISPFTIERFAELKR